MMPEQEARQQIDALLAQAGWQVFHLDQANIHAHQGVATRKFPLKPIHSFDDDLLYVDGKTAGVIEAKKRGAILSGVYTQPPMKSHSLCE